MSSANVAAACSARVDTSGASTTSNPVELRAGVESMI